MSATTTAAAVAAWSVAPGALDHGTGPRYGARACGMRPTVRATRARTTGVTSSTGTPSIPPFTTRTDPPGPHPVG